jgi:hypothetical protein
MNKAIQIVSDDLNISIPEYTIAGEPHGNFFAHHWYVACNDHTDKNILVKKIDDALKSINDDYAVERGSALKELYLDILPESTFMDFMKLKGKIGGQHKFPRVIKGKMLEDWKQFLATKS